MMKIDKMDREAEKRQRERQLEIKNKDIESIIKKTKQEIKDQERREQEGDPDAELAAQAARMQISHEEIEEMIKATPVRLPQ
jgi:flagellar biosynthesis protein FlhB